MRNADGAITTFDPNGSADTFGLGIGSDGAITGYFADGSRALGFLRAASGSISAFHAPQSPATYPRSIATSRQGADIVAGYYYDSSHVAHGFLGVQ